MNRYSLSLGLAAVSLLAAPLAFAQQDATPPEASANKVTWSQLDTDQDGALSKSEAAPVDALSAAFDSADTDKDASLTADEYKAYLATRQQDPAPAPTP